jgi:hypothetical protein
MGASDPRGHATVVIALGKLSLVNTAAIADQCAARTFFVAFPKPLAGALLQMNMLHATAQPLKTSKTEIFAIRRSEQRYDSATMWKNVPASTFLRAQTSITACERHVLVTDIGPLWSYPRATDG